MTVLIDIHFRAGRWEAETVDVRRGGQRHGVVHVRVRIWEPHLAVHVWHAWLNHRRHHPASRGWHEAGALKCRVHAAHLTIGRVMSNHGQRGYRSRRRDEVKDGREVSGDPVLGRELLTALKGDPCPLVFAVCIQRRLTLRGDSQPP